MSTPGLLDSVLAAFPDELSLRKRGTGFILEISAPDLSGKLFSSSRGALEAIAAEYARQRSAERDGAPS